MDRDSRLTMPSVVRVLRQVLIHQSVDFDLHDEGMGICFRQEWIHRDVDLRRGQLLYLSNSYTRDVRRVYIWHVYRTFLPHQLQ